MKNGIINFYNTYSKEIFKRKYAIWKRVLTATIFNNLIGKTLVFEIHFASFINLFEKAKDRIDDGIFTSEEDYYNFLNKDLQDFEKDSPDEFMWGEYPVSISKDEICKYVKDFKKPNNYLLSKVYDKETGIEMPYHYIVLYKSNCIGDILNEFIVPDDENEILSIFFENHLDRFKKGMTANKEFNFDYFFDLQFDSLSETIIEYLRKNTIDIEKLNKTIKTINKIKDYALKNYLLQIIKSFIKDLEIKKLYKQCEYCHEIFKYKADKKYCSFKINGKNCAKNASNNRTYVRSKNTLLKK